MEWREWLEAQVQANGTARALAIRLGVDPSKLTRWRNIPSAFPSPGDQAKLAEISGTPILEVIRLVFEAERAYAASRSPRPRVFPGGAAAPVPPPVGKPTVVVAAAPTRRAGNGTKPNRRRLSTRKHTSSQTFGQGVFPLPGGWLEAA